jgi:hypothetical protein
MLRVIKALTDLWEEVPREAEGKETSLLAVWF